MGSSIAQVASSTQPQGQPMGKGSPRIGSQSSLDQNAINADPQGFQQWQQAQQTQQPQQPQATQGKGGNVTFPGQGGQPRMGQPNMYPNTVGQWDNASIQPQQSRNRGGKGKG
jgi:hypothetical protein